MEEPWEFEKVLTADEKVKRYIIHRAEGDSYIHTCDDMNVSYVEGNDGYYGCETGCEYARLEAKLICPHFPTGIDFEYGDWGRLHEMLDDIEQEDNA